MFSICTASTSPTGQSRRSGNLGRVGRWTSRRLSEVLRELSTPDLLELATCLGAKVGATSALSTFRSRRQPKSPWGPQEWPLSWPPQFQSYWRKAEASVSCQYYSMRQSGGGRERGHSCGPQGNFGCLQERNVERAIVAPKHVANSRRPGVLTSRSTSLNLLLVHLPTLPRSPLLRGRRGAGGCYSDWDH